MKVQITYKHIDFEVTGNYIPKIKGKMYLSNGDPGYPSESEYIDDIDILHEGESIIDVLSDKAIEDIEYKALESIKEVA